MLARNAGVELGGLGVRVVNIAPGAGDTPFHQQTAADPVTLGRPEKNHSSGACGQTGTDR